MTSQISNISLNLLGPPAVASGESVVVKPAPNPSSVLADVVPSDKMAIQEDGSLRLASLLESQDARFGRYEAIKASEGALTKLEAVMGDLKGSIEAVVKMYPPYPANSPERLELVNQIIGLRKQIESLVFPPEPGNSDPTIQAMLQERGVDVASLLGSTFGEKDQESDARSISDADLDAMLVQSERFIGRLAEAKTGLWDDLFTPTDPREEADVAERSGQLRNDLPQSVSAGIGIASALLSKIM